MTAKLNQTKTYSPATIKAIHQYLELNEKWKNSFFWSNFGNARERSIKEDNNKLQYENTDEKIKLNFAVDLTRKNAYITKEIYIDDKKTNATKLKTILKNDKENDKEKKTQNQNE